MNEQNTVIVLDVETTGLDYHKEKIIEFAAVKLVDDVITDEYETLINPQQEIRYSSMQIHGISQDMVEDKPTMEEVLPQILEFIGEHPIVGHNVIFDYNFLNQASKNILSKRLENKRIDTQYMFREVFPEEFSHGLESLMNRFDVKFTTRHRAMADTKGLALAYPGLRDLFDQKNKWQVSQLDNIQYLFERYLRIQQAVQTMQAELSDLKSVFKVYFEKGGDVIQSSTGEMLTYNTKYSYNYDSLKLKDVLEEIGSFEKAFKLNNGLIDRMISGQSLSEDVKARLNEARLNLSESRSIGIVKPDKNLNDFNNQ